MSLFPFIWVAQDIYLAIKLPMYFVNCKKKQFFYIQQSNNKSFKTGFVEDTA